MPKFRAKFYDQKGADTPTRTKTIEADNQDAAAEAAKATMRGDEVSVDVEPIRGFGTGGFGQGAFGGKKDG